MNGIGQHELEEALAARAESLSPGVAPADAVLAGARRRGVRRRAAMATVGVLAVTGAAFEVGSLSGGSSSTTVAPGASTLTAPGTASTMAGHSSPSRRVPVVTQQAGLAPGQQPMAPGDVVASGTVDGTPWQFVVTDTQEQVGYHWSTQLFIGGTRRAAISGDANTKGDIGTGGTLGDTDSATIFGFVDRSVAKVVWTGPDGFRQEAVAIPTDFDRQSVVVFPDSVKMVYGDTLTEYDVSGKAGNEIAHLEPDPGPGHGQSSSMGLPIS